MNLLACYLYPSQTCAFTCNESVLKICDFHKMKVHISNVAFSCLVAAAFVKELQLVGNLHIHSDLSLFLYRYDDYMANKRSKDGLCKF